MESSISPASPPGRAAFRLLAIDPDPITEMALQRIGRDQGFTVRCVSDPAQGIFLAEHEGYDVVVVALRLPRGSGIDVCRELRQRRIWAPILVLTADASTLDNVVLFEVGADDVIAKPFQERELASRLAVRWRRLHHQRHPGPLTVELPGLVIDEARMEVRRGGESIPLSLTELRVLLCLARHTPAVVSREAVLEEVWGPRGKVLTGRNVDTHVARLRTKVECNPARPVYVHTIKGVGYLLDHRPDIRMEPGISA
jgi:two-component system alkaline phosphatase synthesis response regulator PhoP